MRLHFTTTAIKLIRLSNFLLHLNYQKIIKVHIIYGGVLETIPSIIVDSSH